MSMLRRTQTEIDRGEEVMNELANDIMELEDRAQSETDQFVEKMRNPNTFRKTTSDVKKVTEWFITVDEHRELHKIPATQLDTYLARFFMNAKKSSDEEYEPDTLKSIQGSINRHLSEKHSMHNIIEDREFRHSRDVLAAKRKLLRQQGKGNKLKRADPLTQEEIDLLYQKNQLGAANATALSNTMFLNNSMYFGMRSRLEHINLRWGDVILKTTSSGERYIECMERATKTRTGESGDARAFMPKMFEDKGNPRCPVSMYVNYKERRPEKMKEPDSPFYVGINHNPKTGQWFINQAMGKNTISSIVKTMCDAADIQGRKVNHSARKTGITTLVHAGIPTNIIQQHSGHKNISSINNYSTASEGQQKEISSLITKYSKPGTSHRDDPEIITEIPDDNDDMLLVRSSQEIVEEALKEIEQFEHTNDIDVAPVIYKNDVHVNPSSTAYQVPSILQGATIHGNVIINYEHQKENIVPN